MRRKGSQIIAGGALAASIAMHVTVLAPAMVTLLMSEGPQLREIPVGPMETAHSMPPLDTRKLKLGIEESTASTVTWIGYEEYEEHLAELRQFEQAAFTVQPTRPAAPSPLSVTIPAAVASTQQANLASPTEAIEPARQFELPVMQSNPEGAVVLSEHGGDGQSPTRTPADDIDASSSAAKKPADADAPTAPETSVEVEVETPPAETDPSDPRTGDVADKESDPTSIVKAMPENWRVGRPLAAHGLELQPRRPEFTDLQRITSVLGNPLVEFAFNAEGVPEEATIIEHTGDSRADGVILASLYRWRAKGDPLSALDEGELQRVQIRIVLNPRAPH